MGHRAMLNKMAYTVSSKRANMQLHGTPTAIGIAIGMLGRFSTFVDVMAGTDVAQAAGRMGIPHWSSAR